MYTFNAIPDDDCHDALNDALDSKTRIAAAVAAMPRPVDYSGAYSR